MILQCFEDADAINLHHCYFALYSLWDVMARYGQMLKKTSVECAMVTALPVRQKEGCLLDKSRLTVSFTVLVMMVTK